MPPPDTEPTTGSPVSSDKGRAWSSGQLKRPRIRVGAIIALAFAVGLIVWLVVRGGGSSAKPAAVGAAEATVAQLRTVADSLGHPIFWLGPKKGNTYELTQTADGKVYIRYLPPGADVGSNKQYLTVGTYPVPGAFAAIRKQARAHGAVTAKIAQGGLAVLDGAYPTSVHAAYPGLDYQVEVYDPTPSAAMKAVRAGQLASIRPGGGVPPTSATAASIADLRSMARRLGHPIYWAGERPGDTYELTQTGGTVFVRYLPPGIRPGARTEYTGVATYPFPHALDGVRQAANGSNAGVIKLRGGGLAVIDGRNPKSIHLAYPNSDLQIEVFGPSPAELRRLVASQKIVPVA
jgi:hypothetical protein